MCEEIRNYQARVNHNRVEYFASIEEARQFCYEYLCNHPESKFLPDIKDIHNNKILGYVMYQSYEDDLDTDADFDCYWLTEELGVICNEADIVIADTIDSVSYYLFSDGYLGKREINKQTIIREWE